jgi:hypothetical protein
MSASIQSNPAYKRRLISAMLEQPASRRQARASSDYAANWSPKLVAAVAGLALVSATGMFLFLFHQDASADLTSRPVAQAVQTQNANGLPEEHDRASIPVPGAAPSGSFAARNVVDRNVSSPAPLEFNLKRSRKFENVGPIGIRLLRVNVRRHTCDLTVRLNNHRIVQRRLVLNKSLEVRLDRSAEPLQITVSSITRYSISGLGASPSATSELAKRLD